MNNTKAIKAKITYTIDMGHPDIKYTKDPTGTFEFRDTYIDAKRYFESWENFEYYIKNDLALVAGGGYSSDHIHDVVYELERIYV